MLNTTEIAEDRTAKKPKNKMLLSSHLRSSIIKSDVASLLVSSLNCIGNIVSLVMLNAVTAKKFQIGY